MTKYENLFGQSAQLIVMMTSNNNEKMSHRQNIRADKFLKNIFKIL